jgi:hypothetical protein
VAVISIHDDRAGRHANDEVFRTATVAARSLAVLAALRFPALPVGQCRQRIDTRLSDHDDAPAVAAVAAVRPAARDVLLATKAHAAITAAARFDFNGDAIDEHCEGLGIGGSGKRKQGCLAASLRGEFMSLRRRLVIGGNDVHSSAFAVEFYFAVNEGEQRVVATLANSFRRPARRRSASRRGVDRSNRDHCGWSLDLFYVPWELLALL